MHGVSVKFIHSDIFDGSLCHSNEIIVSGRVISVTVCNSWTPDSCLRFSQQCWWILKNWDMTHCRPVWSYWHFTWHFCLHIEGQSTLVRTTLQVEATSSTKMSAPLIIYQSAWYHIWEDFILLSPGLECVLNFHLTLEVGWDGTWCFRKGICK